MDGKYNWLDYLFMKIILILMNCEPVNKALK